MEICHDKTKVPAFRGKDPVPSKICLKKKLLESVNSFSYLRYSLSFTYDTGIPNKITKFIETLGTMNCYETIISTETHQNKHL
jgi:hypothetical protein